MDSATMTEAEFDELALRYLVRGDREGLERLLAHAEAELERENREGESR